MSCLKYVTLIPVMVSLATGAAAQASDDICQRHRNNILGDPFKIEMRWLRELPSENLDPGILDASIFGPGNQGSAPPIPMPMWRPDSACDQSIVDTVECFLQFRFPDTELAGPVPMPRLDETFSGPWEPLQEPRNTDEYAYATLTLRPIFRAGPPLQVSFGLVERDIDMERTASAPPTDETAQFSSGTISEARPESLSERSAVDAVEEAMPTELRNRMAADLRRLQDTFGSISVPLSASDSAALQNGLPLDGAIPQVPFPELSRYSDAFMPRTLKLPRACATLFKLEQEAAPMRKKVSDIAGRLAKLRENHRLEDDPHRREIIKRQIARMQKALEVQAAPLSALQNEIVEERARSDAAARRARDAFIHADPELTEMETRVRLDEAAGKLRRWRQSEKSYALGLEAYRKGLEQYDTRIAEAGSSEEKAELEDKKARYQKLYEQYQESSRRKGAAQFRDLQRTLTRNKEDGFGPTTAPGVHEALREAGVDPQVAIELPDQEIVRRAAARALKDASGLGGTATDDANWQTFLRDFAVGAGEERAKLVITPDDAVNKLREIAEGETTLEEVAKDHAEFAEGLGTNIKRVPGGVETGVTDLAMLGIDFLSLGIEARERALEDGLSAITGTDVEIDIYNDRATKKFDRTVKGLRSGLDQLTRGTKFNSGLPEDKSLAELWNSDPAEAIDDLQTAARQNMEGFAEVTKRAGGALLNAADGYVADKARRGRAGTLRALGDLGHVEGMFLSDAGLGLSGKGVLAGGKALSTLTKTDDFATAVRGITRLDDVIPANAGALDAGRDVARAVPVDAPLPQVAPRSTAPVDVPAAVPGRSKDAGRLSREQPQVRLQDPATAPTQRLTPEQAGGASASGPTPAANQPAAPSSTAITEEWAREIDALIPTERFPALADDAAAGTRQASRAAPADVPAAVPGRSKDASRLSREQAQVRLQDPATAPTQRLTPEEAGGTSAPGPTPAANQPAAPSNTTITEEWAREIDALIPTERFPALADDAAAGTRQAARAPEPVARPEPAPALNRRPTPEEAGGTGAPGPTPAANQTAAPSNTAITEEWAREIDALIPTERFPALADDAAAGTRQASRAAPGDAPLPQAVRRSSAPADVPAAVPGRSKEAGRFSREQLQDRLTDPATAPSFRLTPEEAGTASAPVSTPVAPPPAARSNTEVVEEWAREIDALIPTERFPALADDAAAGSRQASRAPEPVARSASATAEPPRSSAAPERNIAEEVTAPIPNEATASVPLSEDAMSETQFLAMLNQMTPPQHRPGIDLDHAALRLQSQLDEVPAAPSGGQRVLAPDSPYSQDLRPLIPPQSAVPEATATRFGEPVPLMDRRAAENLRLEFDGPDGKRQVLELGDRLGSGATSSVYLTKDGQSAARLMEVGDGTSYIGDTVGRRLLEKGSEGADYFRPTLRDPQRAPVAGMARIDGKTYAVLTEELVPDARSVFGLPDTPGAPRAAPLDRLVMQLGQREMTARGLVSTDTKLANLGVVPDPSAPLKRRLVQIDTGGIFATRGATPAERASNARAAQLVYDQPAVDARSFAYPYQTKKDAAFIERLDPRAYGLNAPELPPTTLSSNIGRTEYLNRMRMTKDEFRQSILSSQELMDAAKLEGIDLTTIPIPD